MITGARRAGSIAAGLCWVVVAGAGVIPAPAAAQAKAKIEVLVAQASTQGSQVDPRLAQMARDFKQKMLAFTSYRVVGESRFELADGQAGTVALPNGRTAQLTLLKRSPDGKLRMRIQIPGAFSSEYDVGPRGELYLGGGPHQGAELWLVVRH